MAHGRLSPRHQFTYVLKVFDGESGEELGHVGDASPEGLLLVGKAEIEAGTLRQLRIPVPLRDGGSDNVELDAESRWSRHVPEPEGWLTGFSIKDSDFNSRMLLASLIHDDV